MGGLLRAGAGSILAQGVVGIGGRRGAPGRRRIANSRIRGRAGPSRRIGRLFFGAPQELPLLTSMSRSAACSPGCPGTRQASYSSGHRRPDMDQRIGWTLPKSKPPHVPSAPVLDCGESREVGIGPSSIARMRSYSARVSADGSKPSSSDNRSLH